MMTKRKTNALKTACLYLLILLLVFTAAFTTACNEETQNATPPAIDNNDEPDDSEQEQPKPESPKPEQPKPEEPDTQPPEPEEPKPEQPVPPEIEEPTKHKFAGTWRGWIIDLETYEYKIIIDDNGELSSGSYFCYLDDSDDEFIREEIERFSVSDDSVTLCTQTKETTLSYNTEYEAFAESSQDYGITLTKDDLISVEEFLENVNGSYCGNDNVYEYGCDITVEFNMIDCSTVTCTDNENNELSFLYLYAKNGAIIVNSLENEDTLYYLRFNLTDGTLTFLSAPSGETNIVLQKVISA
ncbi:MAG: hypothetical protein HFE36_02790 [Clostridia bacterium]|nr:hypothetical protein [Clostridia bacterium]